MVYAGKLVKLHRPCKTWEHVIMEDLRVKGLRREVAQNRAEWISATT